MHRKLFSVLSLMLVLAVVSSTVSLASAQDEQPDVSGLLIPDGPVSVEVSPLLTHASGQVGLVVQLLDAPLAVGGGNLSPNQQRNYLRQLGQKQNTLLNQIRNLGGTEIARVSKALNAVIISIDASQIGALTALPNVRSVRPVGNYELDLTDTVPYIGATEVQTEGFDGTGVRVAVLDSGIDYTHYNLGGSGVVVDFDANNPTVIESGTFPTAKVVGGFDFVGETWTGGAGSPALAPDPDPLDKGSGAGHGTHVADIIAGKSTDSLHKGVAPGAGLYAVGVCSKITTSCSGVALLQGMDFALDPNGDNSIDDAVDVVNMSLGSSYGQAEDDLSEASANAVRFGVVVVASAGNSADRPYIVGSPSSTPEVISVAQTQVPSALAFPLVVTGITPPTTITNTATVEWAPVGAGFTGQVVRLGRGCPAGSVVGQPGADPYFNGNSPAGRVALIDRGACNVSLKVDRATKDGAVAVLIANNAAGDPPTFSFGGGDLPMVPTLIITLADGNRIKTALGATGLNPAVTATVSPAVTIPLIGSMVASSSRGPSVSYNTIKPDIGAPGASVSAVNGTGNGETAFGGTSGAAPMVSGSVALLLHANPSRTPFEIKSVLMNTADTNVQTNPATLPGVLAPITRIGGGEVRVDAAEDSTTAAWDQDDLTGSLSFGYHALTAPSSFQKTVVVRNYGGTARTYSITPGFRYADDAASGAVSISTPGSINVPANGSKKFKVQVNVNTALLPTWNLNGGSLGGNGSLLQGFEFDGYITIADATDNIHVAWQILPHKSAEVTPASNSVTLSDGAGTLALSNAGGAVAGRVDVFSLLGTSGRIPPPALPDPGDNFAIVDLKSVGVRQAGATAIQFAVDTFGTRAHPNYPAEFDIFIDTNRDGTDDFVIFNLENGGFAASGQNVVAAGPLPAGPFTAFFFTDADLNSGNTIMTVPLSAIGLTPSTQFDFSVFACDNYFTGLCTDAITDMTYTLGMPRYFGSGIPAAGVPAGGSSTLAISAITGGDVASPSQSGLLLMYRDGRTQREADQITVSP